MDPCVVGSWIAQLRRKRDEWFGPPGKPPDLARLRAKDLQAIPKIRRPLIATSKGPTGGKESRAGRRLLSLKERLLEQNRNFVACLHAALGERAIIARKAHSRNDLPPGDDEP